MKKSSKVTVNSAGGPVFLNNVDNNGTITGRIDMQNRGLDSKGAIRLFNDLFKTIERHKNLSVEDKVDLRAEIEELRKELTKKEKADETFLMRRLRNISRMAPDILEVTLATIVHPALGLGVFAKKLAEKARSAT